MGMVGDICAWARFNGYLEFAVRFGWVRERADCDGFEETGLGRAMRENHAARDLADRAERVTRASATARSILSRCESPMESAFAWAMLVRPSGEPPLTLIPQYEVGPFRCDFLIRDDVSGAELVVEIDGAEFHEAPDQVLADKRRDRHLARLGHTVVRFTGREVYRSADDCATEARDILLSRTQGVGKISTAGSPKTGAQVKNT